MRKTIAACIWFLAGVICISFNIETISDACGFICIATSNILIFMPEGDK